MEQPPKKKPNILSRLLLFALALAIVLGAVCLVLFRDHITMDALRRWFSYRSISLSDSGQAESFRYSGTVNDVFADLDGDLLVCTGNTISLYSGSGAQYVEQQVSMSAPAVDVYGDTAVVYDAGGTELHVFSRRALAFSLTCDGSLLSAHLNGRGDLTVVSQESGYRGAVTVYDRNGTERAALRLSSAYIMEAVLADDGSTLSVVTIGQQGGAFTSTLSVYDLSAVPAGEEQYDVQPTAAAALGGSVILSLRQGGDTVFALGDRALHVLNAGALTGTVDWSDLYLKSYSLAGDGFAVALLGKYRAGSQSLLYAVDSAGVLTAAIPLEEQVLSLSAAGQYFAVLTADRLDVYDAVTMELYSSLSGTQGARKVLLRSDGTAMLISAGSATLYVPS